MKLIDPIIKAAKPQSKPYKLVDGHGLTLLVNPNGSKWWRYRYKIGGKEKMLSLGVYPEISLKQARDARADARALIKQNIDPSQHRKAQKAALIKEIQNTFEAVSRDWWEEWRSGKSERHASATIRSLERNLFPEIGHRPISQIDAPALITALEPVQSRSPDTARRLFIVSGQVFRYAVARRRGASRDPTNDFNFNEAFPSTKTEAVNYARISEAELPELLFKIDSYQGNELTKLAIKFMMLTFVRTRELTGAKWDEIDWGNRLWRIPAGRMKKRTAHLVPLSSQSIEILEQIKRLSDNDQYIFHGEKNHNKPMHFNTLLYAIYDMGFKGKMTTHGFRGLAATILRERQYPPEHVELQLSHLTGNATTRAYDHSNHLPERAQMMQNWADYLDGLVRR
jgi:integrase